MDSKKLSTDLSTNLKPPGRPPSSKKDLSPADAKTAAVAQELQDSLRLLSSPSPTTTISAKTSFYDTSSASISPIPDSEAIRAVCTAIAHDASFMHHLRSSLNCEVTIPFGGIDTCFAGRSCSEIDRKTGFAVTRVADAGSFSRVLFEKVPSNPPKCLKMIAPILKKNDPEIFEKLQREKIFSEKASTLGCPFLVEILESCIIDTPTFSCAFILMIEAPGKELFDIAKDPSTSLENRIRMARDSALAIQALHSAGIVHKDIKLENIKVDMQTLPDGSQKYNTLKLLDFGFSAMDQNDDDFLNRRNGTLEYASPEILFKKPQSKAVDVYAFGVMLHTLIARTPLWFKLKTDTSASVANKKQSNLFDIKTRHYTDYADPHKMPVSLMIYDIIVDCLQSDPIARPTITQIISMIDDILDLHYS